MKVFKDNMHEAAEILRNGGLVAVPTETVYGLAGNGTDSEAVSKIYEVKGRPSIKPLSLMVHDPSCIDLYCEDVPEQARFLAEKYWPGPLTIVMKSKPVVPEIVRAGGSTVGLRCPDHLLTLEALRLSGIPFAAPSANPSGFPSPKNAGTVIDYFDGLIAAVIDGGECGIGLESTIIDMSSLPFRILRRGALPEEEIADTLSGRMRVIGLTGSSGSGKSTAAEYFRRRGIRTMDCDVVYHNLLKSDEEMNARLKAAFPFAYASGELDRKLLAAHVFSNPDSLALLNNITHGFVAREVLKEKRKAAMNSERVMIVEASELLGSPVEELCTEVVLIRSEKSLQLGRIIARDSISGEKALSRLDSQTDKSLNPSVSRIVDNNGTIEEFENRLSEIL